MDAWTPRQTDIVSLARTEGRVSVEDLAARFERHAADHPQGSQ